MNGMHPDVASLLRAHGVAGSERALVHNGFSAARITSLGDGEGDGGGRMILKRVRYADDWIMRETSDLYCREGQLAASPVMARLPRPIAAPSVGAARDGDGAAILMRDISPLLLPDDQPVDAERADLLLSALAAMHAAFWDDALDDADVRWCGVRERLMLLSPSVGQRLIDEGRDFGLARGWAAFEQHAPAAAREIARALFDDPTPIERESGTLPQTLVHGDIKFANAGVDLDGGVVWLFDWALVSRVPVAIEMAWFPAVNTPQLPWSPDETLDRYARHLHGALGDDRFAAAQWPRQRALAAVGTLMTMGWAKALDYEDGRPHELAWVCERGIEGARTLGWM
jgi:hypothetical protein